MVGSFCLLKLKQEIASTLHFQTGKNLHCHLEW